MKPSACFWILTSALSGGISSPLWAAEPQTSEYGAASSSVRNEVFKTIRLNHVEAQAVASAIHETTDVPVKLMAISVDRLVIAGASEDVQMVLDKYIPAIDVPGVGQATGSALVIPVKYYPIGELIGLVRTVAPKALIGIDERNKTLVVNAADDSVTAIRELLKQIDQPAKSPTVQFFFIRANQSTPGGVKDAELPPGLQPIGKTLADNGFARPTLLAPMMVTTQEGHEFKSVSVLRMESTGSGSDVVEFKVEGAVRLQEGGQVAQLSVWARMGGVLDPGKADHGPTFDINTSLSLKVGNYVVLAAAPSSSGKDDAIALVIRVVPND